VSESWGAGFRARCPAFWIASLISLGLYEEEQEEPEEEVCVNDLPRATALDINYNNVAKVTDLEKSLLSPLDDTQKNPSRLIRADAGTGKTWSAIRVATVTCTLFSFCTQSEPSTVG
jgi:hypothetical protein